MFFNKTKTTLSPAQMHWITHPAVTILTPTLANLNRPLEYPQRGLDQEIIEACPKLEHICVIGYKANYTTIPLKNRTWLKTQKLLLCFPVSATTTRRTWNHVDTETESHAIPVIPNTGRSLRTSISSYITCKNGTNPCQNMAYLTLTHPKLLYSTRF